MRRETPVVGRFRSGRQLDGRAVASKEWRITTGDPEVADKVYDLLGGDKPQEWAAKGEDNLEVFTATSEVEIILDGPKSLRQKMVLWSRAGKLVQSGDGQVLDDGTPDPDAALSFQERKAKARDGIGAEPQIEVYFRIAGEEELGLFKFQTGSWSLASDLVYNKTEEEIEDYAADSESGKVKAILKLEPVEFTAKNGPRAGQLVSYVKPSLIIRGAA
ncbi:hypothetical protein [Arthrobacter zhaoguopingii]|uniref:recombination directionality factor n=1 Tax=Arthrobacter zhaoguopingii TaxID=2681491 RepID=UPI0013590F5F|nr:hypothetical protein [Arthrobacter zhaoguopingii]